MKIFDGFTKQQRNTLLASWRRPSARTSGLANSYVDEVEQSLISISNAPKSALTLKSRQGKSNLSAICKHVHALTRAIDGLTEDDAIALHSVGAVVALSMARIDSHDSNPPMSFQSLSPLLKLRRQLVIFAHSAELLSTQRLNRPKEFERWIIMKLARLYVQKFGRVSFSQNSNFVAFTRDVGPMVGLELGFDLIKSTLKQG